ncbi:DUF3253 domain-containing protein [Methylobacterium isbiliense]|jgi:hypothetical protein|uniref:DUF3253 domain-containing protein n=1 Tax=Methylobacterium isbiliense TaxID=315478 RepID=A0ABQ4S6R1_9HYPH|nr:DUF3253 domain-containing protein [Methylobacterium isbiliense]MDN3624980.1 DUF3253 domain-containing protein [Methylobacterium isbiliense]GJD98858.1 hypothetical protein GMJLKIPL_0771 [Methylobacterium isbiliense]
MTSESSQASPPAKPDEAAIAETLLRLVAERGADKTVCPSEVARALGGPHPDGWGPLMQPVRRAAVRLMKDGRIVILRKGRVVDPDDFRGVYRLSLPR